MFPINSGKINRIISLSGFPVVISSIDFISILVVSSLFVRIDEFRFPYFLTASPLETANKVHSSRSAEKTEQRRDWDKVPVLIRFLPI
jgi:hypothetical protein